MQCSQSSVTVELISSGTEFRSEFQETSNIFGTVTELLELGTFNFRSELEPKAASHWNGT